MTFRRLFYAVTKSKSKDLQLYMEPKIANRLMQLNADNKFSVCNLNALHESIMATSGAPTPVVSREQYGAAALPVVSTGEQNTELTSNLLERSKQVSAPQHQNLPSSQNPVVK
jgi:hypothetical protein